MATFLDELWKSRIEDGRDLPRCIWTSGCILQFGHGGECRKVLRQSDLLSSKVSVIRDLADNKDQ